MAQGHGGEMTRCANGRREGVVVSGSRSGQRPTQRSATKLIPGLRNLRYMKND